MAVKNWVQAVPQAEINSAGFNNAFQAINPNGGLPHGCFLIRIINDSTVDIDISYDGVVVHDFLKTKSEITYNFQSNSQPNNFIANMRGGQIVWVAGNAGVGEVKLTGYYQV